MNKIFKKILVYYSSKNGKNFDVNIWFQNRSIKYIKNHSDTIETPNTLWTVVFVSDGLGNLFKFRVWTGELLPQIEPSDQTIYRWKSKYGGMEISETKRLKQLEKENRRFKQIVADLTLDNQALKLVVQKKN